MPLTLQQAFELAASHHQQGRLGEAEWLYRKVLATQPDFHPILHLLGVLCHQAGRNAEAIALLERAVQLAPQEGEYHGNLGVALAAAGLWERAGAAQRQAVALRPQHAQSHYNLGLALFEARDLDGAIASYRNAISLLDDYPQAWTNLGNALQKKGQTSDAIATYRKAIALSPTHAEAHYNLANVLREIGQTDEAIAAYRQVVAAKPNFALAWTNLADALRSKGQFSEAIEACRAAVSADPQMPEAHYGLGRALEGDFQIRAAAEPYHQALTLRPDYAQAHVGLASLAHRSGLLDRSIALLRQAIEINPRLSDAHAELGNVLKDAGELDEALESYRRAISVDPERWFGNLLYAIHLHPDYDRKRIWEEHRSWNQAYGRPLARSIRPYDNDRFPDRRLRLGYISPDFRNHPVGRFLLPLLANHDHANFEVICYSDVRKPDELTQELRKHADRWRDTMHLSDERLAEAVREDRVDLLVDLTMHTEGSRLGVFARKPAPVQVTWLAYCSTTGLETIDFRLSDPYFDPPAVPGAHEEIDAYYSERSIRLPHTYWCYQPLAATPDVSNLPALDAGRVTFGCLNNFSKVTPPTLAAWRRLLRQIPHSSLLLHCQQGGHRQKLLDTFARDGIDPDRLEFSGMLPTPEYFQQFQRIDIALDPFPCAGGTTTCDALWMGVPVVSLAGQTAVSRAGLSILSNVGLPELVAHSPDQYVQIAGDLAGDLPRLGHLRETLRSRMRASPLMDAPRFASDVEAALRQIWRDWCAKP